ncbi:selenoprotein S-like [Lepisosteus oculatus]|uniref:Selenoprotein S n=1 Tax=Lepisosteus oculatus TaxID=7918 RepID=W5N9Q0_LEPOC|nr:PREDICTED: selenoprotein S-like isoform X2 [Lepisosteus oculatus]XP_015198684.1 PREDICTED: selenoprotein S-like isoform X2 [Lepisosteus oculatus]XP_015198685.1 PREDICTED: selenoprotein S-like isoform X2 [Lepisosteus oculatus]
MEYPLAKTPGPGSGISQDDRLKAARLRMQKQQDALVRQTELEKPSEVCAPSPSVKADSSHNQVLKAERDPREHVAQDDARRAAWLRMQDKMDADAEHHKARLMEEAEKKQQRDKEAEEQKKKEKIEKWEFMQEGKSYRGKAKAAQQETSELAAVPKKTRDKKPLRSNDYNPLSGDGGCGSSWRASRRSGGG